MRGREGVYVHPKSGSRAAKIKYGVIFFFLCVVYRFFCLLSLLKSLPTVIVTVFS